MKRAFSALLAVTALLLPLAGCDLLSGWLGLGYTVGGTVAFSSSAQTADGTLYVRLLSTVEPGHTGSVEAEQETVYRYRQEQESFRFTRVAEGDYHVLAFIDMDADGVWTAGEPVGGWPNDPGSVPALARVSGSLDVPFTVWMNGPPIAHQPVSIVYDSSSPADTARANAIRTILQSDLTSLHAGVTGTMPRFDVTLVPQGSIPAVYDMFYVLPGGADPVILTPGVTRHGEEPWCHNVANQGMGILAMGNAGSWFFETASTHYGAWGYLGQSPSEIRYMNTWSASASSVVVRNPAPAWTTPLLSAAIPAVDGATVALSSSAIGTTEAYKSGGAAPAGGEWFASRVGDPEHFSTGRQGRFVLFGFEGIPDKAETAHVLLVNLVQHLADNY